jgi:hypothetical protein
MTLFHEARSDSAVCKQACVSCSAFFFVSFPLVLLRLSLSWRALSPARALNVVVVSVDLSSPQEGGFRLSIKIKKQARREIRKK